MAFDRWISFQPGGLAQAFESSPPAQHCLLPDSVESVGIRDRLRDTRQERWPERDRQRRNGCMVDPALDGPREIVEFRNDCPERPADSRLATIRAAAAPSLHKQRAHKADR